MYIIIIIIQICHIYILDDVKFVTNIIHLSLVMDFEKICHNGNHDGHILG